MKNLNIPKSTLPKEKLYTFLDNAFKTSCRCLGISASIMILIIIIGAHQEGKLNALLEQLNLSELAYIPSADFETLAHEITTPTYDSFGAGES
jgi:hypothetical protein